MNRLASHAATAVASLLIGGVAGAVLVRKMCDREMAHSYVMGVLDQANAAREIYSGRSLALADRIREKLPEYVLAVEKEFPGESNRDMTYRMVRRVYEASSTELPASIQAIVASVPPPADPMKAK